MADLYSLLMGDDPSAQAQADALARLMRQKQGYGSILQMTGDRTLAPVGQQFAAQGAQAPGQIADLMGQRQKMGLLRAGADREAAALTETARHNKALETQAGNALAQEAWAFGQDPTGGGFMFNKKTGQVVRLAPQGSFAGAGSGLKPNQFEADVQQFGKDVEPLSKAAPDITALRNATAVDDVAGFGPVAGRVPNMLMGSEGVANRQAAGRLMAAIIQATSGQAASEKEVDRLLEANGMGRTATTEQLRLGVGKLEEQYQNLLKQREAKYHPDVVRTYGERGGYTSTPTAAPLSGQDAEAKAWADANPGDPRAAKIVERLKAKGL